MSGKFQEIFPFYFIYTFSYRQTREIKVNLELELRNSSVKRYPPNSNTMILTRGKDVTNETFNYLNKFVLSSKDKLFY